MIEKVAPEIKGAYEKNREVDLEETLHNFTKDNKSLRHVKDGRLVTLISVAVFTIAVATIFFLFTAKKPYPDGRIEFVWTMFLIALAAVVFNYRKDSGEIARLERSKNEHQRILDRFSTAVRSLCLNSSDFHNLVYLNHNVITNNLVKMAIDKKNAEGFQRIVEHPDSPDNPIVRKEAKHSISLTQLVLHNALYRLDNEFDMKFEEKHIFQLATRRMNKSTEPLREFPANPKPKRRLPAEALLVLE